jgi:hypothetical protein
LYRVMHCSKGGHLACRLRLVLRLEHHHYRQRFGPYYVAIAQVRRVLLSSLSCVFMPSHLAYSCTNFVPQYCAADYVSLLHQRIIRFKQHCHWVLKMPNSCYLLHIHNLQCFSVCRQPQQHHGHLFICTSFSTGRCWCRNTAEHSIRQLQGIQHISERYQSAPNETSCSMPLPRCSFSCIFMQAAQQLGFLLSTVHSCIRHPVSISCPSAVTAATILHHCAAISTVANTRSTHPKPAAEFSTAGDSAVTNTMFGGVDEQNMSTVASSTVPLTFSRKLVTGS